MPDPTVITETAVQEAQSEKRRASDALRRGDIDDAERLFLAASVKLSSTIASAPASMTAGMRSEAQELDALAHQSRRDAVRTAKESYASWHRGTRKRGRPTKREQ